LSKPELSYSESVYLEINTIQGRVSLNGSSLRLEFASAWN
jgi:hypothetical protein